MPAAPFPQQRVLAAVAGAAAAGNLINSWSIPVHPSNDVVLGTIPALLVALAFGPWAGLAAGAGAALRTYWLFGHPWAVVLFGLEACVVGWASRRGRDVLMADLLYWAAGGIPLGAAVFVFGDSGSELAWARVAKYPVNGILCALIALVIWNSRRVREWVQGAPARPARLEALLRVVFLGLAAVPVMVLAVVHGRQQSEYHTAEAAGRLNELAAGAANAVDAYLVEHRRAVEALAESIRLHGDTGGPTVSRWLDEYRRLYPGFLTMLAADSEARIFAASPMQPPGRSVGDRDYFRAPMASGRAYISDAFRGRGFGSDPIVAISAPFRIPEGRGAAAGIVEGSLNLDALRILEPAGPVMQAELILTDSRGRVVYASRAARIEALRDLAGSAVMGGRPSPGEVSFRYLDRRRPMLAARAAAAASGWSVVVQQPLTVIERELSRFYLLTVGWAFGAIAISAVVSRRLAARVAAPLRSLADAASGLSVDATGPSLAPAPRGTPTEVGELTVLFEQMRARLHESYAELAALNRQLRELNTGLEAKVAERTAELDAALKRAEEASAAKTAFLGNMSHDIRTPLNAVIGYTELLRAEPLTPEQEDYAARVLDGAHALLRLMEDMLDMVQFESGKLRLHKKEFDPAALLNDVVRMFALESDRKGISVRTTLGEGVPARMIGDAPRLRRVITNLLGNAIKFTEQGSVAVAMTAEGGDLHVEVRDTGIGMDPEFLPQLFTPFTRAEPSTRSRFGGTGLGLAISRRLVEAMGGEIGVASAPGQGSTFRFRIPMTDASAAQRA